MKTFVSALDSFVIRHDG